MQILRHSDPGSCLDTTHGEPKHKCGNQICEMAREDQREDEILIVSGEP